MKSAFFKLSFMAYMGVLALGLPSQVNARSTTYSWTTAGSCAEYTPHGVYIRSVSNDVCRRTAGSRYNWTTAGSCAEYTPSGTYIRSVSNDVCRRDIGSYHNWTTAGSCAEYTHYGNYIRSVSNDVCRRDHGSYYRWTTGGSCAEYTPSGDYIRAISNDVCRRSADVLQGGRRSTPVPPVVTNPAQNFRTQSLSIAERIIEITTIFESYVNASDYVEIILPLKAQAARLESRVKGRAEFERVKNTLIHLGVLLNDAEYFIEDNMERQALSKVSRELLTMQETVRTLTRLMDQHKDQVSSLY